MSHRLHEVFRLADNISVLKDGRLVTTVPTTDVRDRDHLVSLILGRQTELGHTASLEIGDLGVQADVAVSDPATDETSGTSASKRAAQPCRPLL